MTIAITIADIKKELSTKIADAETFKQLLITTFKGLTPELAKQSMLEAMMRGWKFEDFLQKNIYAVPFYNKRENKQEYSLVTSIDYARKIGMRSGVCGKSAPTYEEKDGKIISCSVTVKRKVGDAVGDYSDTAYFDEYNTGRNLWISKPRTMIAKVAEMHALRMACPEELSQLYVAEEFEQETEQAVKVIENNESILAEAKTKLEACQNLGELQSAWVELPAVAKNDKEITDLKNKLKLKYEAV